MADFSHPWRPRLTKGERCRGGVFFALYFLVFPFVVYAIRSILGKGWGLNFTDAAANGVYHFICAALIFVIFWAFLKNSFYILLDHPKENLFALASGLGAGVLLTLVVSLLPLPVENPCIYIYPEQFALSPGATVTILVILWPIIEETLFRGLLFGGLRRHSRALAWVVSIGLFLLFKVWQFAFLPDAVDLRYLILGVQYLPMALALTWCYDVGGSIWSAIGLHALSNALSLFLLIRP